MGLFNFILGSSKKEQEKPIRDKRKDREYFEKILRNKKQEILDDEKSIQDKEVEGYDVDKFLYEILDDSYIKLIQIRYSMDVDIKELKYTYMDSLNYFLLGFENDNPIYDDILNRVSLGILLNIPTEYFKQLVDYVQRMDEQAKPADWTSDLLLWFMLNSRLKEDDKRTHAEKLAFPKLYKGLYKVT